MDNLINTDLGNKEIFAKNLNRYLSLSGKSQKEVAAAVGVSSGTFCDWTKGRLYPRMNKLQLLADYFEISKSDLVEEVNVAKEAVTNKEQQVLDLFHKIPDGNKDAAIKMLQALADNL
jgi:repressor LexA